MTIHRTDDRWLFEDIASEVRAVFPTASVWSSDTHERQKCQLAIIPYLDRRHTIRQKRVAAADTLPFAPEFVGFYDLSRRRLALVRRQQLPRYYTRCALEQALRFAGRVALGARARILQKLRRQEHEL